MTVDHFKDILEKGVQAKKRRPKEDYIIYGVRE